MSLKHFFIYLIIGLFILTACSSAPTDDDPPLENADPVFNTEQQVQSSTPLVIQTSPPIITPLPTAVSPTPTADQPSLPTDISISPEDLQLFPVPDIFSGDKVTFQVMPSIPAEIAVNNVSVDIYVDDQLISSDTLESRNWAGRAEGIYEWQWDTTGHPGDHIIRIVLDAGDLIKEGDENDNNNEITVPITIRKAGERPLAERDEAWITAETDCCKIHALTNTAAYRDLPKLLDMTETAVAQAAIRIREEPDQKLDVYFIDRTIGNGGYAGDEIVATYVDRAYAGGNLHELLVHEAVHVLDRQFAPQRLKFLAEGLAVWASGGHYKAEDLNARMAALIDLGLYIPLEDLLDDFYLIQHETGYLEAGGFVSYLVDAYGYELFRDFYSATSAADAPTLYQVLDLNLQKVYGKTLPQMEAEWLQSLRALPSDPQQNADLRTSIRYYEAMRSYQNQYDPTSFFLTAWLPHPQEVLQEGNPADLRRHPQSPINITLEVMFRTAEAAMLSGDYNRSNIILDSIDRILNENGAFADPISVNYRDIVDTATNFGYEVQDILLNGDEAEVLATTASGIHLSQLNMERRRGDWVMASN